METSGQSPTGEKLLTAQQTARRAVLVGIVLSVVVYVSQLDRHLGGAFVPRPLFDEVQSAEPLPRMFLMFASLCLGMGLGALIALTAANRKRFPRILRPTRARIIGAVVLALVTPLVVYAGFIFSYSPVVVMLMELLVPSAWANISIDWAIQTFGAPILHVCFSYLVSCLIVAGTRSRILRVVLFVQVCLAVWSVHVISYGIVPIKI